MQPMGTHTQKKKKKKKKSIRKRTDLIVTNVVFSQVDSVLEIKAG